MNHKTYIKTAKNMSNKSHDELAHMALTGTDLEAVVQEVWKRKNPNLIRILALSNYIISNPKYCKLLAKFIQDNKDENSNFAIVEAILSHPSSLISQSFTNSLFLAISSSSMDICALILISAGTPTDVILEINKRHALDNANKSSIFINENLIGNKNFNQNKLLESIIKLLKNGYSISNTKTANILMSRLSLSSNLDAFATSLSKYSMSPEVATIVQQKIEKLGAINPEIKKNFDNNNSEGVKTWKTSKDILSTLSANDIESFATQLLNILNTNKNNNIISYFLDIVENKCFNSEALFIKILSLNINGQNIFLEFAKKGRFFCERIITMIKMFCQNKKESFYLQHMSDLDPIFDIALKEFQLHNIMFSFPNDIKKYIPLLNTEKTTQKGKEKNIKKKEENDGDYIMDDTNDRPFLKITSNWYEMYKIAEKSKIGLRDWLSGTFMTALMTAALLLAGKLNVDLQKGNNIKSRTIEYLSNKYNLNNEEKEKLEKIINDKNTLNEFLNNKEVQKYMDENMPPPQFILDDLPKELLTSQPAAQSTPTTIAPSKQEIKQIPSTTMKNDQKPTKTKFDFDLEEKKNIIARTLWAEARGEDKEGMEMVASVIYNRGNGDVDNMLQAITKPRQFACWGGMTENSWINFQKKEQSGKTWQIAKEIADQMVNNAFSPTTTATHYYSNSITAPSWALNKDGTHKPYEQVGNHIFIDI